MFQTKLCPWCSDRYSPYYQLIDLSKHQNSEPLVSSRIKATQGFCERSDYFLCNVSVCWLTLASVRCGTDTIMIAGCPVSSPDWRNDHRLIKVAGKICDNYSENVLTSCDLPNCLAQGGVNWEQRRNFNTVPVTRNYHFRIRVFAQQRL